MDSLVINEKVSYFLNIAVFALVFSIFTLWKTDYLIYGLITFVYGLTGHVIDNAFDLLANNNLSPKAKKGLAVVHILLFIIWLIIILTIAFCS
ncbi:MAG: hypothetical protein A3I88_01470 [Candidatus Portnoybacteria bacterium RIFCSPLOWO2_12_FULL_39_9]|uniref:Uncharacterized protein n=1 Tax=Candidatus Portnoybacteria bacterium RIFCSPHIGHO2_12_FULL_38_9 TaxID=1801997 RepID=A0A1G2FFP2_9BACT|nr:MAG: hypothetical protein A3H00_01950 [Candidatus Portnoybacteria bacterium RBG_13_40_8]OGZ35271.1 MAG: hypothetical protein A2646_02010 [Candidatus Portnoybacteria bacterium RIFCSPHIGHO2_02_FULL_39_12]OGZ36885.1 MAG: hypothetical protein A3J64_03550 [Candidatus Portnoybacteria bacterium RIFCSPHIGHO2_12_FULL_38_9]OGZ38715.1 MAG: hypothetical protein A3F21_01300 [Candidatus Portnoybacteria bacterium RIFCSPLOWO2_01_FULL_38_39]OGZ40567.1 MAG: hypothetical protein A3I88_01470 [Candidatus Portnoy